MDGTGYSKLLLGEYDCHVHAASDVVPRAQDWLELGEVARAGGLAGLVLKDHTGSTAGQAQLLNRIFADRHPFFGSLTLNPMVGGLNPHVVAAALRLGAAGRQFWSSAAAQSVWTAWNLKLANFPVGRWVLVAFAAAILLGHLFMKRRPARILE